MEAKKVVTKNELLTLVPEMTETDFNYLYNIAKDASYKEFVEKFQKEGILDDNEKIKDELIKKLILEVVITSKTPAKDNLTSIAEEMRLLFPEGLKPGTHYSWRGSLAEITQRLNKLQVKFNIQLNKKEVLEATQRYINSFNNDTRYMQLCKYFIYKNNIKGDMIEFNSALLDYMENKEINNNSNNDWLTDLK